MHVDANGDLVLETAVGEVRQHKPLSYQESNGVKTEVSSRYVLRGRSEVSIAVDAYDASKPIVIDPVLSYAALEWGGGHGIAVDNEGNAYVTSEAAASVFSTAIW